MKIINLDLQIMTIARAICFTSIATLTTFTLSYLSDTRAAIYKHALMPLSRFIDPEHAHTISILFAKFNLVPKQQYIDSPLLKVNVNLNLLSN